MDERAALVEELKKLMDQDVMAVKDQVDELKTKFYRIPREEVNPEEVGENGTMLVVDESEQQFKDLLNAYKQKRAEFAKQQEAEMEQNTLRKENIITQMKAMAESETADVMNQLQKMRDLQAEWKTIGSVLPQKAQTINKQYQIYQEQFYDLVKINIELRDLDFKKNLEAKTLLCEAAEKLAENPSIVEANRALQQLHEEWAEIGPVARELREDLWNRFKEASSVINKKHQAYFDELHAKEKENLETKQGLIAELKEIDFSGFTKAKQWDEATQKVQDLQTRWRQVGFAPKKQNQAIYEEYRTLCDAFFAAKNAYYKDIKNTLNENLKQKKALLARAEEIMNGEAAEDLTQEMIHLQAEWKKIGPVARKYSDEIWKKFQETCDQFFDKKRQSVAANKKAKADSKNTDVLESGDRNKLIRMYQTLQQEIKTAENNILFFSGKSKAGNKIVSDLQKKIDALKEQLVALEKKINEAE